MRRKLCIGVSNAQEAREAMHGGARILDVQDPGRLPGELNPRRIMDVADAAIGCARAAEVRLSASIIPHTPPRQWRAANTPRNWTSPTEHPEETAGRAARAALGVACAMGSRIHPRNMIKVHLHKLDAPVATAAIKDVVATLRRTESFCHCQVVAVVCAQDIAAWRARRGELAVRRMAVARRQFHLCEERPASSDEMDPEGAFDLQEYAVGTLRRHDRTPLFTDRSQVSLGALIAHGVLPDWATHTRVQLDAPTPHASCFSDGAEASQYRTTKRLLETMVEGVSEAGADSILLDTFPQAKLSRIGLVDTSRDGNVTSRDRDVENTSGMGRVRSLARFDVREGLSLDGILSIDEIGHFVRCCHSPGLPNPLEAYVAGSIQSYHAQQLWVDIPDLDGISAREATLADVGDTGASPAFPNRVICEGLVRGLVPPELGGVLNLPHEIADSEDGKVAARDFVGQIAQRRRGLGLPKLEAFFVNRFGKRVGKVAPPSLAPSISSPLKKHELPS